MASRSPQRSPGHRRFRRHVRPTKPGDALRRRTSQYGHRAPRPAVAVGPGSHPPSVTLTSRTAMSPCYITASSRDSRRSQRELRPPTGPLLLHGLAAEQSSPFEPSRSKVAGGHVDPTSVRAERATVSELIEHVLVAPGRTPALIGVQREIEQRNAAWSAARHPNQVVGDGPAGHDAAVASRPEPVPRWRVWARPTLTTAQPAAIALIMRCSWRRVNTHPGCLPVPTSQNRSP